MIRLVTLRRTAGLAWVVAVLSSCASLRADGPRPSSDDSYGPLTVNADRGADLYITQDGAFAPATVTPQGIVIRLANLPFQIGTSSHQINLCLTLVDAPEIRVDPSGHGASCLSGPFQAARDRDADYLFVFPGTSWSDGNNLLADGVHRAAPPRQGYARAFQVNELQFIRSSGVEFSSFRGTIYGWVVVYREQVRHKRDIMPIRLVFQGG